MEEASFRSSARGWKTALIASRRTMGSGRPSYKADEVAVEAMRKTMDAVQMDGTIVIGAKASRIRRCCTSAKKLTFDPRARAALFPEVDIASRPVRRQ